MNLFRSVLLFVVALVTSLFSAPNNEIVRCPQANGLFSMVRNLLGCRRRAPQTLEANPLLEAAFERDQEVQMILSGLSSGIGEQIRKESGNCIIGNRQIPVESVKNGIKQMLLDPEKTVLPIPEYVIYQSSFALVRDRNAKISLDLTENNAFKAMEELGDALEVFNSVVDAFRNKEDIYGMELFEEDGRYVLRFDPNKLSQQAINAAKNAFGGVSGGQLNEIDENTYLIRKEYFDSRFSEKTQILPNTQFSYESVAIMNGKSPFPSGSPNIFDTSDALVEYLDREIMPRILRDKNGSPISILSPELERVIYRVWWPNVWVNGILINPNYSMPLDLMSILMTTPNTSGQLHPGIYNKTYDKTQMTAKKALTLMARSIIGNINPQMNMQMNLLEFGGFLSDEVQQTIAKAFLDFAEKEGIEVTDEFRNILGLAPSEYDSRRNAGVFSWLTSSSYAKTAYPQMLHLLKSRINLFEDSPQSEDFQRILILIFHAFYIYEILNSLPEEVKHMPYPCLAETRLLSADPLATPTPVSTYEEALMKTLQLHNNPNERGGNIRQIVLSTLPPEILDDFQRVIGNF